MLIIEFCNREEAKNRIKAHAVETRRQITIVKNDNVRVRAKCDGTIPNLTDDDMACHEMAKGKGVTINEGGQKKNTKDKLSKDANVKGKGKKVITDEEKKTRMSVPGIFIWLRQTMVGGW